MAQTTFNNSVGGNFFLIQSSWVRTREAASTQSNENRNYLEVLLFWALLSSRAERQSKSPFKRLRTASEQTLKSFYRSLSTEIVSPFLTQNPI